MSTSKRSMVQSGFLFAVLMISFWACDQNCPTKPDEITGDYIFVERIILTNAVVLAGDSTRVGGPCLEPHLFYDFYPTERRLEYRSGQMTKFPVNNDLKVILGDKHFYFPRAGCGGGPIYLTPSYFLISIWSQDGSMVIAELDEASGLVAINYLPLTSNFLLKLKPGETFQKIFEDTRWVKFDIDVGGRPVPDSALVKYIDRVTITNWGFAPRNKISWKDFTSP